jgi:hypothetical protein
MARKSKNRKSSNSRVRTKQEPELNALRRSLLASLSPHTALESIAAETVVACSLRCKVAAGLGAKSAAHFLGEQTPEAEGVTSSQAVSKVSQWYGASRESLRAGIRFLSRCKDDFETNARTRDDWKKDMDRGWGEELFADLKKWEPSNLVVFQLADQLVTHQQLHGGSLPGAAEGEPEVMPDPLLNKQMVSKLLSQEIRHLHSLALVSDQKVGVARGGFNGIAQGLASHDLKSVMHDLQRALEWFMRLRRYRL